MPKTKHVIKRSSRTQKFISAEAEQRYEDKFKNKPLLHDLGFIFSENDSHLLVPSINQTIERLNWQLFCAPRFKPDEEVVKEFYANLWPTSSPCVTVRGKQVDLNSFTLNALFHLQDHEGEDEFTSFVNSTYEKESILEEVATIGTTWKRSITGHLTCKRENLKDIAKVWFYFLRHSLMPTTHASTIKQQRVCLLASILQGRKINVGRIMEEHIRGCATKRAGELIFPTAITMLCKQAGVQVNANEVNFHNPGMISIHDLVRLTPRLAQEQPLPPHQSTQQNVAESSSSSHMFDLVQTMHGQQQQYWAYSKEWNEAYYRSLPRTRQASGQPWPLFPEQILQPYVPSMNQQAEDEDDDE